MKLFYSFIFILFGILSTTTNTIAQSILEGLVYSKKTNKPIENALVILDNKESKLSSKTGKFIFKTNKGKHSISIQAIDYESKVSNILITDKIHKVKFELKDNVLILDEIILEEDHIRTSSNPGAHAELLQEDFFHKSQGNTVINALSNKAGIQSINTGTGISKASIRGLSGSRISVMSQGMKQEGQQWGNDHGLEMDQYSVEEVEVIKGAETLRYGSDAIGGVINFKASKIAKLNSIEAMGILNYKSNNESVGIATKINANKNNKFFNLDLSHTDYGNYKVPADQFVYLKDTLSIRDNILVNTGGKESHIKLTTGIINEKREISITGSNYNLRAGMFPGAHGKPTNKFLNLYSAKSRKIGLPRQEVNHLKLSLNAKHFYNSSELSYNIGYQENNRNEKADPHDGHHNRQDVKINSELEYGLNLKTVNANLHYKLDKDKFEHNFGNSSSYQKNTRSGYNFILPSFDRYGAGIYSYSKFRANKKLDLSGGARVDYMNFKTYSFTDTLNYHQDTKDFIVKSENKQRSFFNYALNLGMNYRINSNYNFGLSVAKVYRFPDQAELTIDGYHNIKSRHEKGDFDIDQEDGYQFDFQLHFNNKKNDFNFSPYYYYFTKFIYLSTSVRLSPLQSARQIYEYKANQAYIYGFEVDYKTLLFQRLTLEANAEYTKKHNLDKGIPLPFSPPLSTFISGEYNLLKNPKGKTENAFIGLEYRWTSAQEEVDRNEAPTDGYQLVNLNAGTTYNFEKIKLKLNASVKNIFDTKYMNHLSNYRVLSLPEQGRNLTLNLIITIK